MNQCMGCQAGWPRKWLGSPVRSVAKGRYVHEVVGGYPHEIVACTKERYEIPK